MNPVARILSALLLAIVGALLHSATGDTGVVEAKGTARHWSFQPVHRPEVPVVKNRGWVRNDVDRFILARLEKEGLQPSPEATRLAWIRRVYLDLIGLPPTPEQVRAFLRDKSRNAHERVVGELLDSPRYGERWAQHWLDVVRFADTHGFEVNTERPNAWPYRDYVIEAFNRDTPYDQFIREQLAGDQLGADAATGFMVTASVLLPGQIGADDVSKRLARQDSLDEIVVNTGQTFLGLSVGCARCHDHKVDPITSRDYYSMQAFFAGVEYGDRELRTPEALMKQKEAAQLKSEIAATDRKLALFEPMARPGSSPPRTMNARTNTEVFAEVTARFVRFTIHDTALHPTLGLIEPCLDEFEIFSSDPDPGSGSESESAPRNVALAAFGTKVTTSGSRVSDLHRPEHLNDGRYGNSRSWMSDEAGRGWVQFELPRAHRISRIVWGRDREGKFEDRLPIAWSLEAGETPESMRVLAEILPSRPQINAVVNSDRFPPVKARRVRFTIKSTNNLEPCVDELEVMDLDGRNVALASSGTTVTSRGSTVIAGRHELRFINDGVYGNSSSWMSSDMGTGSVTLEFPQEMTIERVLWGRDRNKEYTDRLATSYQIETAGEDGVWHVVADSSDRRPFDPSDKKPRPAAFTTAGLNPAEARRGLDLLAEKKRLESQLTKTVVPMAFAGTFRDPDRIHLLNRGDPEQPRGEVAPAIPVVLGRKTLSAAEPEHRRRRELANWIASPENPLTARVMVNRIWQGHFGTGIVETSSDFGRNGTRPTHPELLDWLASEFVRSGWSMKSMHRLIVLSATYRQSSRLVDEQTGNSVRRRETRKFSNARSSQTSSLSRAAQIDSDVRLLWRYPSRRLESEPIRDSMLAVSGALNLKMYGRGFDLFNNRGGLSGFIPVESFTGDGLRRMIYAHKVRREREAVFGAFDCPDAGQSTTRRRESTTPLQALNLFNSRFTLDQSTVFAGRVRALAGDDIERQIRQAWWLALGRDPSQDELSDATPVVRKFGLPTLCRVLFNSNEFLFFP